MRNKVLYVVPTWFTLYYDLSGHLSFLKSNGFEVAVACETDARAFEAARREDAIYHEIDIDPNKISPLHDLKQLYKLIRLIKQHKYDIVHSSTKKGCLLTGLAGRLSRVSGILYHVRGVRGLIPGESTKVCHYMSLLLEKINCRLAHKVIFISKSNMELFSEKRICNENKMMLFGGGSSNGVDVERFKLTDSLKIESEALRKQMGVPGDAYVLGFVGRPVYEKGIRDLVEAWKLICDKYIQLHLLMLTPPETDSADALSILQRDPRVHFTGFMSDPTVGYAAMDCLIIPSIANEGFGNTAIEGGAMELPVIATAEKGSGLMDAVVHEKTGLLLKPKNPLSLSKAIERVVTNQAEAKGWGRNARMRCLAVFRQELIWQGFVDTYREFIRAKETD